MLFFTQFGTQIFGTQIWYPIGKIKTHEKPSGGVPSKPPPHPLDPLEGSETHPPVSKNSVGNTEECMHTVIFRIKTATKQLNLYTHLNVIIIFCTEDQYNH